MVETNLFGDYMNTEDYINIFGDYYLGGYNYIDEHDKPVTRTKQTHPYSYDGFVQYRGGANDEANATIYSDRLVMWDYSKHERLCMEYFGDKSQYWSQRDPKSIQAFLRDWEDNQELKLILVMEYCNASNGYPCWRFDYCAEEKI